MEISEMKRPVLTMLSGPAASVMGSLMYLRASNGVYFEVGGTTTNIGVIKDGRPAIDYSVVGGHRTYISSLDVRVLGVAGGSMVRADKNGVKRCRTTFRAYRQALIMQYLHRKKNRRSESCILQPERRRSGGLCCNRIKEWKTYHHYEYMCSQCAWSY